MRQIGRYKLVSMLGAGGMGQVFKAVDPQNKETVAIKIIKGPLAVNELARVRFVREARAAAQLQHSNIVAVRDFGQSKGALYIVMEYLEGLPLSKYIPGPPRLSLHRRFAVMVECAEALACAHAQGIVHRDIKPDNILILKDRSAKVVDFGLAEFADLPNALVQGGTPPYMSPEQLARKELDGRSDIWSLAVTLYELLYGRVPYRNSAEIVSAPPPTLPHAFPFSVDCNAVLARALSKDPRMRYGGAEQLAADLRIIEQKCASARTAARERELSPAVGEVEPGSDPVGVTTVLEMDRMLLVAGDELAKRSPAGESPPRPSPSAGPPPSGGRYSLPNLGFQRPAEGDLETSSGKFAWKARERALRELRFGGLLGGRLSSPLLGAALFVWCFGLPCWLALKSHSHPSAPESAPESAFVWLYFAIPALLWPTLIAATRVCAGMAVLEQRPRCRCCGLRMQLTARWTRVCSNPEEVIFGYRDCMAALKHRLWQDAAKLLSIYGIEQESERGSSRYLSAALRFHESFFECNLCGHHAARLTTDEKIEAQWEERPGYEEVYWGRPSPDVSPRKRFPADPAVYLGSLAEFTRGLSDVRLTPQRLMFTLAIVGLSAYAGWSIYRQTRPGIVSGSVGPNVLWIASGGFQVNQVDGQRYVWIPPGSFQMGCSPGDDECSDNEKPVRKVQISKSFLLGQSPVTQLAYRRVKHASPSRFPGNDLPVEMVSWQDASAYCRVIGGRLPTEWEWEYAARAGNQSARYGTLNDIAWYVGNSGKFTHPVGQKTPNAFGLYDMLGNVWEWTQGLYGVLAIRGGSFADTANHIRSSIRVEKGTLIRAYNVGFRCAANQP
jgi:serine/threonine-protein kinase